MKDRLILGAFRFLIFLFQILPDSVSRAFFRGVAFLLYHLDKRRKHVAYINLDFAYDGKLSSEEKRAIVKGCYENLALNLLIFMKNLSLSREALLNQVNFENTDVIEDAIRQNRKIVFITAHYGFWEIVSLSVCARFLPAAVVGRPLGIPSLDRILIQSRERFGVQILDRKGALKGLIKALKEGKGVGMLVDQNTASQEGILIDFFGKKARHVPTAAVLARKFDAVIIPVFVESEDKKHFRVRFEEPIETSKSDDADKDILESVQKQAAVTERIIRQNPKEWFWFHRRWKNQYEEIYQGY